MPQCSSDKHGEAGTIMEASPAVVTEGAESPVVVEALLARLGVQHS